MNALRTVLLLGYSGKRSRARDGPGKRFCHEGGCFTALTAQVVDIVNHLRFAAQESSNIGSHHFLGRLLFCQSLQQRRLLLDWVLTQTKRAKEKKNGHGI